MEMAKLLPLKNGNDKIASAEKWKWLNCFHRKMEMAKLLPLKNGNDKIASAEKWKWLNCFHRKMEMAKLPPLKNGNDKITSAEKWKWPNCFSRKMEMAKLLPLKNGNGKIASPEKWKWQNCFPFWKWKISVGAPIFVPNEILVFFGGWLDGRMDGWLDDDRFYVCDGLLKKSQCSGRGSNWEPFDLNSNTLPRHYNSRLVPQGSTKRRAWPSG